MTRRLLLLATLLLVPAGSAWAHASPVRSTPGNGAVLSQAPAAVTVEFDSGVRVGSRNAAIRNDGLDVLRGAARVVGGRTLVVPLRPDLPEGDYSVRWSAVSDDGHAEEGVIAFAVGEGRPPPVAALEARGILTWQRALMRTLFLLGVLGAAGATLFALAVLRPLRLEERALRPQATLLFACFLLAFVGADALIHATTASGTRFERVLQVAATVAALGGAAAALAPLYPRLRYGAWGAAAVLFVCPTLAGHALDPDQPRLLSAPADLLHLGAAAVWLGGLASLAYVAARAPDGGERVRAARRFSALALGAVAVVAATGLLRAYTELASVGQLWSTGYGRALVVKTALFVPLLGIGFLNRSVLIGAFARLRRSVLVELTVLTALVVAVAVLTDLRPGTVRAAADVAASQPPPATKPPLPPRGAFVDARQAGSLAVAVAVGDGGEIVTVLRPDGTGASGLRVVVDGLRARACGAGCYRTPATTSPTEVRVGSRRLVFEVPVRLVDGMPLLRRATRAVRSLRSLRYEERLRSGERPPQVSEWRVRAPNAFAYRIRGGAEGIVIGARRWDRQPGGDWVPSPQTPLRVPKPYWSAAARNAYVVEPGVITFVDPRLPGWFRLRVDPRTGRPLELRMTAAAHFMTDRYSGFDAPVAISPPSR